MTQGHIPWSTNGRVHHGSSVTSKPCGLQTRMFLRVIWLLYTEQVLQSPFAQSLRASSQSLEREREREMLAPRPHPWRVTTRRAAKRRELSYEVNAIAPCCLVIWVTVNKMIPRPCLGWTNGSNIQIVFWALLESVHVLLASHSAYEVVGGRFRVDVS